MPSASIDYGSSWQRWVVVGQLNVVGRVKYTMCREKNFVSISFTEANFGSSPTQENF